MQTLSKSHSLFKKFLTIAFFWLAAVTLAQAHPNHSGGIDFSHGFGHPLGGLDHILAMVAVGLWAAQLGGRAVWLIPSVFVGTMAVGGFFGLSGVPVPGVEQGIFASVFVLGLLIAVGARFPLYAGASIAALFALFHGYAHGAEMPVNASGFNYGCGFVLATAFLHVCGITLGVIMQRVAGVRLIQVSGLAIIASGFGLLLN